MTSTLLAIAPIFVLIVLGHLLRRGGIPSIEFWNLNDKLVYWVLFPALLFYKTATMEMEVGLLGDAAAAVYTGFAAALLFAVVGGRLCGLSPPAWTSVLQGCARHNTFIALAVAERLLGPEGLATAVLVTGLLIPLTNVSIVTLMTMLLKGSASGAGVARAIGRELARNPVLIAVALGFAVNASGIEDVPVLFDVARILGAGALPIVLLCVGANIRIRAMAAAVAPTALSMIGKLVVFPVVTGAGALAIGLDPRIALVVMIFAAAPTSANAYTLARQMGGDGPAMAAIVTLQTAVAFVSMPLTLMLAQRVLGG